MSKALKLRVTDDIGQVVCNEDESEWKQYDKVSENQPDSFYTEQEEQQLTIFRSYIDNEMCVESSDLSAAYKSCHIVIVFDDIGLDHIVRIKSCSPDRKSVETTLHAMLCEIGDRAGYVL